MKQKILTTASAGSKIHVKQNEIETKDIDGDSRFTPKRSERIGDGESPAPKVDVFRRSLLSCRAEKPQLAQ